MSYGSASANRPASSSGSRHVTAGPRRGNEFAISLACSMLYLVLYTIYDILCAKSAQDGGGYYRFEPAVMVFVIELGKFAGTLVFLAVQRPEVPSLNEVTFAASRLSSVAVCFVLVNVINLICLAKVSLASYSIWFQTSIVFNAVFWYMAFRVPFGVQKCLAMAVLTLGCIVNSMKPGAKIHIDSSILLVVLASLFSALGCVLN